MTLPYLAVLFSFTVALLVAGVLLGAGALARPWRPSPVKAEAFECGNPSSGSAWGRFSVKFYLTAILFPFSAGEGGFLSPWAVISRPRGMFGFIEMAAFVLVVAPGFVYAGRKGPPERG